MNASPIISYFHLLWMSVFSSIGLCCAQEIYTPDPSRMLTRIPIRLATENVLIIQGTLPGYRDTLSFILDTGSSGISLDSTVVSRLGLEPQQSDITLRGIASVRKAKFIYDQSLLLGSEMMHGLNFHINDYEFLSYVYGVQVDGIIGYAMLSRYIVKLDYDSLHMDIYSPGAIRYPKGGHLLSPDIRTLPTQTAIVADHHRVSSRFLLDIGAGLPLVLTSDFVQDSSLVRKSRRRFPVEAHGVGGSTFMTLTLVRRFKLGPYRFKKVPVLVFDDEYNVLSYPYMGGLIGNQILKRFNTIINYPAGEIHLTPNSLYREAFTYSYSGMEIYAIDGSVIVGSVVSGSPADAAGVKENDILIAINNDFTQDFGTYKNLMMRARKRMTLIIMRDESLQMIRVKLQRLR